MNYKDIKDGFAYVLEGRGMVTVIGKNAGWVNVQMVDNKTKRVRAGELSELEAVGITADLKPVEVETGKIRERITTPAKKVRPKKDGLKMKINGFRYRVRFLDDGDKITNRCMFREKGSNGRFLPCDVSIGTTPADHYNVEYIEILSTFYKPPA